MTTDKTPTDEPTPERAVDLSELCFSADCFSGEAVKELSFAERLEGNHIVKSSSAVVVPPAEVRWDYHTEAVLRGPKGLSQRGVCVRAARRDDGSMEFLIEGAIWELDRASVKNIEIFGMSNAEIAYWFPQLTGLVRGVEIPGLTVDTELRPFMYAVPLRGLTAKGDRKFFFIRDFGITSGDADDVFNPLLANSNIGKAESVWQPDVPKAWGVVFARDLIEAEGLALGRAQFTADLISFSLRTGMSHFDTRYESELLEWDVHLGRSRVILQPWILMLDQKNTKGWIRTLPLIDQDTTVDLDDVYDRISFFAEHFLDASEAGDFVDQTERRSLTDRERKLSAGIQRSLRWLGIASNEESVSDQFIATWISLESVLNAIVYPGVFDGDRETVGDTIREAITELRLPKQATQPLMISEGMISGRVLQNQWPPRTKLELFAKAWGVDLKPGDSELVRDLGRLRNEVFHDGRNDPSVSSQQLRQLQYLVERLVSAASVYGYEDIEEQNRYQLQFGEIGPEGGGAPLSLDGRDIPYVFRIVKDQEGRLVQEFVIEGKIYNELNSDVSFTKEQ